MEIAARLDLYGFERKDFGEQGAVFLRYETPQKDERKSEIWVRDRIANFSATSIEDIQKAISDMQRG